MSEPFLGEIRPTAFAFAPKGWALCNGQLLPIAQNQALFAILGTTYGGDGRTNFALPDLRGRSPAHTANTLPLGARVGEEAHTLTVNEIPPHTHGLQGASDLANNAAPVGNLPAAKGRGGKDIYAAGSSPLQPMSPQAVAPAGGSQPHNNMQPYLAINFIIAMQGIFPSRN
ncbi:MAG: phage tail protein [Aquabacterium sp.]|uniref:phage tail protein n=1 Tax=Aquabacterium sp. TaxID=1872578 RepID=UPI0025BF1DD9|nr:tail fiber protein [Aquabacterium sp.]MBI5925052.1 phage tail protein [Aquabacterium sp.]